MKEIYVNNSPEEIWSSTVYEKICSAVVFASTYAYNIVTIRNGNDKSSKEMEIFSVSDNSGYYIPKLYWRSDYILDIQISKRSIIQTKKCRYGDVNINYIFDPSDGINRQEFLQQRGILEKECEH